MKNEKKKDEEIMKLVDIGALYHAYDKDKLYVNMDMWKKGKFVLNWEGVSKHGNED